MDTYRTILSADSLTSDPVKNLDGDKVADVRNIMIDVNSGRVAYVVLSYGGFLGMGDKLFAVPWDKVRVDQDDHALVIDLNEEVMSNAPGFDKDEWPDFASHDWNSHVHAHYGLEYSAVAV